MPPLSLHYRTVENPHFGALSLVADDAGALVALHFGEFTPALLPLQQAAQAEGGTCQPDALGKTDRACAALDEYFAGTRRDFDDLPLAPRGGTAFQRVVWAELRRIPFGETRSYGQLAAALGKPGASRAVGRANGANPIPLVVPCHRVIGANGALTGFSAVGGIATKRGLLAFERSQARSSDRSAAQIEINFAGPLHRATGCLPGLPR